MILLELPFPQKNTLHCAERMAKLLGYRARQLLKFEILYCEMYSHYLGWWMFYIELILFWVSSLNKWTHSLVYWSRRENYFGKIVFGDNNSERKLKSCLRQTSSIFWLFLCSNCFVNLLTMFGCFWRFIFWKSYNEATVWVWNLLNAAE